MISSTRGSAAKKNEVPYTVMRNIFSDLGCTHMRVFWCLLLFVDRGVAIYLDFGAGASDDTRNV